MAATKSPYQTNPETSLMRGFFIAFIRHSVTRVSAIMISRHNKNGVGLCLLYITAFHDQHSLLVFFFTAISSTGKSTELLPLWFGVRVLDGGPLHRFILN